MKLKPKGRKIYRQKTRFERLRRFKRNTGAVVTTLLLAGVLYFVGYSVGKPVLEFLQERKVLSVPGQGTQATEPRFQASPSSQEEILSETQAPAETEPEETVPLIAPEAPEFRGYLLAVSSLTSEAVLQAALEAVPEGATHILVPLKTAGGSLYYATTLEDAGKNGAVKAVMPLEKIYELTAARGAEPVAVVNVLEDQLYPASFSLAAYHFVESEEVWRDAPEEAGGKPWLSPFSELTVEYLSKLTGEIAGAGFTSVLCEGLRFPEFPEGTPLEEAYTSPDRYTALVRVVEAMQNAAPDVKFYLEIDGMRALNNQSDALRASEQLSAEAVMVTVNSATAGNADLLRTLARVHPSILLWNGTEAPAEETSFVQAAPAPAESAAENTTEE